jgi:hypothetical protein
VPTCDPYDAYLLHSGRLDSAGKDGAALEHVKMQGPWMAGTSLPAAGHLGKGGAFLQIVFVPDNNSSTRAIAVAGLTVYDVSYISSEVRVQAFGLNKLTTLKLCWHDSQGVVGSWPPPRNHMQSHAV